MKCSTHNVEANGVCAYCGRAVCSQCSSLETGQRTACSLACSAALGKEEAVVELILKKNVQGARATAMFCYLLGLIFLISGLVMGIQTRQLVMFLFLGLSGMGMMIGGIFYGRIAKKQPIPPAT